MSYHGAITDPAAVGCFAFRRWPSSASRLGYLRLGAGRGDEEDSASAAVRVVVGRERREFLVDPFVLERDPFRGLMAMAGGGRRDPGGKGGAVFVDVDAILFEHLLWLAHSGRPGSSSASLLDDLREIVEFYSQDS